MGAMYDVLELIEENKRLKQQIKNLEEALYHVFQMRMREDGNIPSVRDEGATLHRVHD